MSDLSNSLPSSEIPQPIRSEYEDFATSLTNFAVSVRKRTDEASLLLAGQSVKPLTPFEEKRLHDLNASLSISEDGFADGRFDVPEGLDAKESDFEKAVREDREKYAAEINAYIASLYRDAAGKR